MQPDSPASAGPKIAFHRQIRDLTQIPIWLVPMLYALATMALTAIVFSVAYITVQFNSVAYSPRLALWVPVLVRRRRG